MNWKKTHAILHTIIRYFLASIFLLYAIAKILGTQFSTSPSIWDKRVDELSGFQLTWFYFGYSFWYGIFIVTSQVVAAFLLFFRKTVRLGIVLYLSIIINILVIDFTYEIDGAKGMALVLTAAALFVLFSEFSSFHKFFIKAKPLFSDDVRPKWMSKYYWMKYIYIPIIIVGLFTLIHYLKINVMTKNEFYGAWKPVDYKNWERVYFQEGSHFSIRDDNNFTKIHSGKYKLDRKTSTIDLLNPKPNVKEEGNPSSEPIFINLQYKFLENKLLLKNDTVDIELVRLR